MGIFSKSKAEQSQSVVAEDIEQVAKDNEALIEEQERSTQADALERHIKDDDPAADVPPAS